MATQTAPASRLMLMQLKFQEKQQQTREERRVELFGSATKPLSETTNVPTSNYPGKVRAMFDERRRGAGIDRSQPLKPITSSGTTSKSKAYTGLHSNGVNTAPSKTTTSNRSFSSVTLNTVKPKLKDARESENEHDELDTTTTTSKSTFRKKTITTNKVVPKVNLAPVKVKKTPPTSSSSTTTTTSKIRQTSAAQSSRSPSPPKDDANSKTMLKKTPNSAKSVTSVTPVMEKADLPEGMKSCKYCNRNFLEERLPKHEAVCAKLSTAKRKVFDASAHRVRGTEAEKYVRKPNSRTTNTLGGAKGKSTGRPNYGSVGAGIKVPATSSLKKNNWRQKHEEFIAAIRAAKELKAHLAAGGKLSDLPPPPPSENPDYIQCPHCSRRFNESAAERHIPKCANMLHNKPKPGAAKATPTSRSSLNKRR